MDTTHPSADSAHCAASAVSSAAVTSMLAKLLAQSGRLGAPDPMHGFLSYGSLKVVQCDSVRTAILPLSPWALLPLSQALPKAILDTHISGEPVILCFANTSWRLLIVSQTVTMPSTGDGGSFGSVAPTSTRVLQAKLHVQPQGQQAPNSIALRAWHAMVPAVDDNAMLSFLCTALHLSLPISIAPSAESLSEQLLDDGPPPDEDESPE